MNFTNAEFRALVEEHQDRAHSVAYGLLRNPEDAREVVQEAFLRVHLRADTFEGLSSFSTWLYRIVVNLSIDSLRKRRGLQVELDDNSASAGNPHDDLQSRETVAEFEAAFEALPPEHREVFVLREVEELSYEELAVKTGVPIGTVMSRLFHARKKLREGWLNKSVAGSSNGHDEISEAQSA